MEIRDEHVDTESAYQKIKEIPTLATIIGPKSDVVSQMARTQWPFRDDAAYYDPAMPMHDIPLSPTTFRLAGK